MGMGAAPAHGWVISDDDLKKIVPVEFEKLEQLLKTSGGDLDTLALEFSVDGPIDKTINKAYADLADAFAKATTVEAGSRLVIDHKTE